MDTDTSLEEDTREAIELLSKGRSPKYVAEHFGRPTIWAQKLSRSARNAARRQEMVSFRKAHLSKSIEPDSDVARLQVALLDILSITDATREIRMMRVAKIARKALGLPHD